MKKTLTLLALFLTALLSAQPRQTTYSTVRDISYTDSDDAYAREYCKLDVYYPEDLSGCPVVVWFHGSDTGKIFVSGHSAGGHDATSLYELGGHDHNAMRDPAFHILHTHIRKILSEN